MCTLGRALWCRVEAALDKGGPESGGTEESGVRLHPGREKEGEAGEDGKR